MMRALTYLPVIDFIIFFISSSRDFHASPSLLKTGPLLLAAPLAFRAPSKLRHPRHVVPVRGELAHPGGDLGALEGVSDPGQGGPEGLAGTEPVALPGAGAGGTVLRRARQRVWGGQASPGPSGTRVRRCPLLSSSSLANSRISTTSVRPLHASTVLASMSAGISRLRARAIGDTPRRAANPTLPTRATSSPMRAAALAVHPRSVPDQPRPLLRPRGSQIRHLLGLDASYI